MDYKKYGDTIYVRFDKDDEIITGILNVCKKEHVLSATYSGTGACDEAIVRTYIPEKDEFRYDKKTGVLELISLTGNITADENDEIFEHTHAIFSYIDEKENNSFLGGHLMKAVISYTGEFTIKSVENGVIRRMQDDKTGITVWKL